MHCYTIYQVVSPLVSLMEDQLMSLTRLGISACMLKAGMENKETADVFKKMENRMGFIFYFPFGLFGLVKE